MASFKTLYPKFNEFLKMPKGTQVCYATPPGDRLAAKDFTAYAARIGRKISQAKSTALNPKGQIAAEITTITLVE